MTIDEAKVLALAAVEEINKAGAIVVIKPKAVDIDLAAKYPYPDHLKSDQWIVVRFINPTQELMNLINQKHQKLMEAGMTFDSGGGLGEYNWELDWSLMVDPDPVSYTEKELV